MSTADPLANKNLQSNLQWSLLFLRVGVFIVMFIWTLDKFVNPAHSIKIFEHFYKIDGLNDIMAYGLGALQLILVIAFLFGIKKRLSYGLIFLIHAGSTLSAYALYIDAFNNLLFFAAWPMLAACAALYLLRDADTKFTLGK
ncbi:MAG: putative oxidoreductase [Colwellia sp.]|jgi:putative oxidoreductase